MSEYNKYYKKENYFGNPYPELIKYFKKLDRKLTILDIGCGQGRDALAIGRLGFDVVGVDISSVGIKQLNEISTKDNLEVKGIVADFNSVSDVDNYDVVLLDSMFHFYKKDIEHEINMLNMFLNQIKPEGRLVIILQKSPLRVKLLKETIEGSKHKFTYDYEDTFTYREFNSKFYMISIQKMEF